MAKSYLEPYNNRMMAPRGLAGGQEWLLRHVRIRAPAPQLIGG
jgi:hypothetical protein